jgi:hypothetical protein
MSDPAMLPNIGDPSREQVDPHLIASLREPLGTKSYGRYQPNDPTRLEAAKQLSLAAYPVLFYHEPNHVEMGHLELDSTSLNGCLGRSCMVLVSIGQDDSTATPSSNDKRHEELVSPPTDLKALS